jgi:hypothetical protein
MEQGANQWCNVTENLDLKSVSGFRRVGSKGIPTSRTSPPPVYFIQVHCIGELPKVAFVHGICVWGRGQSNNEAVRVTVTPRKIRTGSMGGGNSSRSWKTGSWKKDQEAWLFTSALKNIRVRDLTRPVGHVMAWVS